MNATPDFDAAFQDKLELLLRWRRDVRRFKTDPLPTGLLEELLSLAALSPSVGNSQPWRFVTVDDAARRKAICENFEESNREALGDYEGERARLYASLKLAGLKEAPAHVAVFTEASTPDGHGLGRRTMPEMLDYSTVCAVNSLWLAARAKGVGMGWVSILDPVSARESLDLPEDWHLVAYLCLGFPEEEHEDPELVRRGWQERHDVADFIIRR